jgi:multidrug efflux system membrane fusion protein
MGVAAVLGVSPDLRAQDIPSTVRTHLVSVIFFMPTDFLPKAVAAIAKGPLEVALQFPDGMTGATGTVSVINNQIDQATGKIAFKAVFADAYVIVSPGAPVSLRILGESVTGRVVQ